MCMHMSSNIYAALTCHKIKHALVPILPTLEFLAYGSLQFSLQYLLPSISKLDTLFPLSTIHLIAHFQCCDFTIGRLLLWKTTLKITVQGSLCVILITFNQAVPTYSKLLGSLFHFFPNLFIYFI